MLRIVLPSMVVVRLGVWMPKLFAPSITLFWIRMLLPPRQPSRPSLAPQTHDHRSMPVSSTSRMLLLRIVR